MASMRGFVLTPPNLVDLMVEKLFEERSPSSRDRLLDPGCGTGAFIEGVIRWCRRRQIAPPQIDGVDSDPTKLSVARERLDGVENVHLLQRDFLEDRLGEYDFVVGNPPYVPITQLSEDEKATYRRSFRSARGRFDLYFLFFEQALRQLKPGGTLVFVTPEKFLYVESARELRKALASASVKEVELIAEDAFAGLVTYPAVTTVVKAVGRAPTIFRNREGARRRIRFDSDGASLLPQMNGGAKRNFNEPTLGEICQRISAGVATGADGVFVQRTASLGQQMLQFAYPTISGRQLSGMEEEIRTTDSIMVPYDRAGRLRPLEDLGEFAEYLRQPEVRARLLKRTCVRRKPWYAFHETPPLAEILSPKILCKDITPSPRFWLDKVGSVVPRHTVYYAIPKPGVDVLRLMRFLSSDTAREWLAHHCQRAANGFIRLQSRALRELPLPPEFDREVQGATIRLLREPQPAAYASSQAVLTGVG